MTADHVAPFQSAPTCPEAPQRPRPVGLRGLQGRSEGPVLPPFWWFLPSVALGLCFWIVVLALLLD